MKKLALLGFAMAMLGASAPPSPLPPHVGRPAAEPPAPLPPHVGRPSAGPPADGADGVTLSTDRKVHGVITAIEPATITIASSQRAVTGRIDATRTKVTVNGKPGKVADLQLTNHAKGELCLDDVWLAIDTH